MSNKSVPLSPVEVGNIDRHGFWLLVADQEYFLPYGDFPWFRQARVEQIMNVELLHGDHLRCPDLDVDLTLDSLARSESFPLVYI
ncbi:MAG: DUF2442 domain-containing protein [Verrucomicrobia bacterium]|nr:MAG: DUF2442 domain-containing protein [Verrucomicrobiota bacterium]